MNGKGVITVNMVLAVLLLASCAYAGFTKSITFPAQGKLQTLGVGAFSDPQCTIPLTTAEWGLIGSGDHPYRFYVQNIGDAPVTLNMTTNSWSSVEATTYMWLTWDQEATLLNPASNVTTTLILHVLDNATQGISFSFNVLITGLEPSLSVWHVP